MEQGPIIIARVAGEHDEYGRNKVTQALAINGDPEVDNAFVAGEAHALAEILRAGVHSYPRHVMACDGEVHDGEV